MLIKTLFERYQFSPAVQERIFETGIKTLYPPQAEAVNQGVLDGKNLLMSVPTAAGKTLIAELCMIKSILQDNGRCLYIVPLKALASEKFEDFSKKYTSLGIKVGIATGDIDTPEKIPNRYQILIATAEKVDSLFRSNTHALVNNLTVVVLDEIHFINDGSRGPTLEILTARLKQLNKKAQILALSATIGNAKDMAKWLDAACVESQWRPIPLKEGVYYNEQLTFKNKTTRLIKEDVDDHLSKLTLDTIKGKGQVLTFVNSRRSAQAASRQLGKCVHPLLSKEEKEKLKLLAQDIIGSESSATKICRSLGETVRQGVAFHHAGLKPRQRKLVEDNFKSNVIKVICSTPTLAAGVNLPARRAIIRDFKRFETGLGSSYIPTSEYKQCAGRAGRPQYDEYGEAVLMAKTPAEVKALFYRYINADPEPVISKLAHSSALRFHILASIAGGYIHDINETFDFLSHTFFAYQKGTSSLLHLVSETFEFLEKEKFIEKNGFRFFATAFGQCTSRLYIDPSSAIVLRDGLTKMASGKSFSSIGVLHLISCCPDTPLLKIGSQDNSEIDAFAVACEDELIFHRGDLPSLDDFFLYLSIMKTTMMLTHWMEEVKEDTLCDEFNIGPGDIYRHTENTRWLLHAALIFAELFEYKKLTFILKDIEDRIRYGVKEELLPLVQLKGIGRVRARNLFVRGIQTPQQLKFVTLEDLAKIEKIGKTLAQEILDQVTGKSLKQKLQTYVEDRLEKL